MSFGFNREALRLDELHVPTGYIYLSPEMRDMCPLGAGDI